MQNSSNLQKFASLRNFATKRKQRIKEKMNQQRPAEVRKEQPIEIYLWSYSTERSTTKDYQGNYL